MSDREELIKFLQESNDDLSFCFISQEEQLEGTITRIRSNGLSPLQSLQMIFTLATAFERAFEDRGAKHLRSLIVRTTCNHLNIPVELFENANIIEPN